MAKLDYEPHPKKPRTNGPVIVISILVLAGFSLVSWSQILFPKANWLFTMGMVTIALGAIIGYCYFRA